MQTQQTSKARVKTDTVGDEGLKRLYEAYGYMGIEQFREFCSITIERSSGKRETKDKFIREIDNALSKETMVRKVTNYLLAGQGLGV